MRPLKFYNLFHGAQTSTHAIFDIASYRKWPDYFLILTPLYLVGCAGHVIVSIYAWYVEHNGD